MGFPAGNTTEKTLPGPLPSPLMLTQRVAYFEQEQLGWEQALRGRLSKQWGQAQDAYYKNGSPTNTTTATPGQQN